MNRMLGFIQRWSGIAILVILVGLSTWETRQNLQPPDKGQPCHHVDQGELIPIETGTPISSPQIGNIPVTVNSTGLNNFQLERRFGFGLSDQADPGLWADLLGAEWYLDWAVQPRYSFQEPEHWQTVRLGADCIYPTPVYNRWIAMHHPGQVWIIGNEPDVIWQDSIPAEVFTRYYHDLYFAIKSIDPEAKIAPGAISQATPLRLAYLDRVLETYQSLYGTRMPVDIWTVHGYVLREERGSWGVDIPPGIDANQGILYEIEDHGRLDLFQQQIISFREWMALNGYRDVPLVLTEFGILMPAEYGFPIEFIQQYMVDTFTWLLDARDPAIGYPADGNRLVQRWAWFSLADSIYPAANLADLDNEKLTSIGQTYANFTQKYQTIKP